MYFHLPLYVNNSQLSTKQFDLIIPAQEYGMLGNTLVERKANSCTKRKQTHEMLGTLQAV